MRIIVTGGAGFIGSNFLNRFVPLHTEHRFVNVDKLSYAANPANLQPLEGLPNYVFERVDVADAGEVDRLFETHRPDAVIHFAAESHVDRSIRGPREFVRTNIEGTFVLLDACRRHWRAGNGRFHHVSTDEVYGSLQEDDPPFAEDSRYDPSSPYSASKAASDHLVRSYHRTYGLPMVVTNCSNNYGPYQFPEKLIPLMILNCMERKPLPIYGEGRNVRDWLYVEDHCDALWTVFLHGTDGRTYNIGGNDERRNIDVVDILCRTVADAIGCDQNELLDLKRFVRDRPGHDLRYAIDASRMRDELGWTPRETFESGLRKTVQWYLDHPTWVASVRTGAYRAWIDDNYGDRT